MKIERILSKLYDLGIKINVVDNKLKVQPTREKISNEILNEIRTNKVELIHYLKGVGTKSQYIEISNVEMKELYPSTSAQKRLYLLQQYDLASTAYNMPNIISLGKYADKSKIEDVFKQLINRHESFRTSIIVVDNNPVQYISKDVEFELEKLSIENTEVENIRNNFIKPFDLSQAPFLRAAIVDIKGEDSLLMIDMHHIISDGVSYSILEKEFQTLLSGEELAPLRLQYKDYSQRQNSKDQKELIKNQEQYWLNKFDGELPVLNLPIDYVRPLMQSHKGATASFVLSKEETDGLRSFTKANDLTLYMSLLSVFNILLSKLSDQDDIIVGTPIAGRNHMDLENIVGIFLNTLALRNEVRGYDTLKEFIGKLKQNTLAAYENQDYQFDDLVSHVYAARDMSRNPIFDVLFDMSNENDYDGDISSLGSIENTYTSGISKFDLILIAVDYGQQLFLNFQYCTKLFKVETIERFVKYFRKIIKQLPYKLDNKVSEIEIITDEEKQQLLYEFNNTQTNYPKEKSLPQIIEDIVNQHPDNIAIVYKDHQISYRNLNEKANQYARLLRKKGVKSNVIVGLLLDRSIDMIISILGILKAGGAYLPIDSKYPIERIKLMLNDCGIKIFITQKDVIEKYSFTAFQELDIEENDLKISDHRPLSNFDDIPIVDRCLIDYEKYFKYIGQGMVTNSITIQATRGCPYNCAYCCRVWPRKYSIRSAENIFSEINKYYELGVKRFVFIDDIFNLDKENSIRFYKLIIKNNLKIQILFPSGLRGDILTEEYIDLMVAAGVVSFPLALETASPRLQKLINKNLNIEKLRKNMQYILDNHPQVIIELHSMHGFPTETEEEARLTLDFIKSLKNIHFPYIHILKIYSNTEMEKIAIKNGVSKKAIKESQQLAYHELPTTLPFNKSFTLKYQSEFFNEYFLSKERLLDVLPYQMQILTENELVQKYNSYLPVEIQNFNELLEFLDIEIDELDVKTCLNEKTVEVKEFNKKLELLNLQKRPKKSALKVLLLDLSQLFTNESGSLYDVIEQPIGIMYLMSYLKEKFGDNINGKIAKSRIDFNNYSDFKKLLIAFNPDVIGIRTLSYYKDFFHETINLIRQWGITVPIIAGGPYATSDYKTILADKNVDLVVMSEGEITFSEIIKEITKNNKKLPEDIVLDKIPGIIYRKSKNIFSREILIIDELDDILKDQSKDNIEINNKSSDLAYIIYTSGSTGKPKGTLISHYNVTRVVKNTNYICLDQNDRVLQLSNYAFDGSVFDVYGALLNGGTLVLIEKDEVLVNEKLTGILEKELITVFFTTTALFNIIVDFQLSKLKYVRKILFGGEKISVRHASDALNSLGKGKLLHVYGPTESTVYSNYYEINQIDKERDTIPIGKPISNTTMIIIDKTGALVPVGVQGELCISGEGLALGYLNNPELTLEKFIEHPFKEGDRLYRTGDLARWLPDGNIEFLGRIDYQVKIRGFRIELGEVENVLLKYENIKESVVVAREENGDKYLCAYIVTEEEFNQEEIYTYLSLNLPAYMIPSYFVELDKISLTSNGKVDRKSLPSPELKAGDDYVAPSNGTEEKLVKIWSEVLNVAHEEISTTADFFAIGGHSLKATVLIGKIHKEIDVEFPLRDVFLHSTIKAQASRIERSIKKEFVSIPKAKEQSNYPLSPAQKRLYFIQQLDLGSTAYNIPYIIPLGKEADKGKIEEVFKELINRHESFRTSIIVVDGDPVQVICKDVEFEIEELSIETTEVENTRNKFIRSFDLSQAPFLRVAIVDIKGEDSLLMIDMHHIISDGTTLTILEKEFQALYSEEELAPLSLQYRDYSQWQNSKEQQELIKDQEQYWLNKFEGELPVLNLPIDYVRPLKKIFEGSNIDFYLNENETKELIKIAEESNSTLFIVLLAIFNVFLSKLSGQEDITIGTSLSGRKHNDLQNVVGMFVNMLSLRNYPEGQKSFDSFLKDVKNETISAFENQDYQFDDLVSKLGMKRDISRNPIFDVVLSLQNQAQYRNELNDYTDKLIYRKINTGQFDITFNCVEFEKNLLIGIGYCSTLFKQKTIEKYAYYLKEIISEIIECPNKKIEEIKITHKYTEVNTKINLDEGFNI